MTNSSLCKNINANAQASLTELKLAVYIRPALTNRLFIDADEVWIDKTNQYDSLLHTGLHSLQIIIYSVIDWLRVPGLIEFLKIN